MEYGDKSMEYGYDYNMNFANELLRLKPTQMNREQLQAYAQMKFGPEFADKYEAVSYTNKLGNNTIKYIKKDNSDATNTNFGTFENFGTGATKSVHFGENQYY